jgi:hypothetical protein
MISINYAECRKKLIMLSVVMPNVIILNVVMLSVVALPEQQKLPTMNKHSQLFFCFCVVFKTVPCHSA